MQRIGAHMHPEQLLLQLFLLTLTFLPSQVADCTKFDAPQVTLLTSEVTAATQQAVILVKSHLCAAPALARYMHTQHGLVDSWSAHSAACH